MFDGWRPGDDRCWVGSGRNRAAVVGPGHDHADRVADIAVGQRVGVLVIASIRAVLAILIAVLPLVVESGVPVPVAVGGGQRVPRRRGPRDRRRCVVRRRRRVVLGDLGELGAGLLDVGVGDLDLVVPRLGVRVVSGELVLGGVLLVAGEQAVGHHVLHPAVVAPVDARGLRAGKVGRAGVVELDREPCDTADLGGGVEVLAGLSGGVDAVGGDHLEVVIAVGVEVLQGGRELLVACVGTDVDRVGGLIVARICIAVPDDVARVGAVRVDREREVGGRVRDRVRHGRWTPKGVRKRRKALDILRGVGRSRSSCRRRSCSSRSSPGSGPRASGTRRCRSTRSRRPGPGWSGSRAPSFGVTPQMKWKPPASPERLIVPRGRRSSR